MTHGIRISEEAMQVRRAQSAIAVRLCELQEEHDLTDIEMLQAVHQWQGTALKYMLRAERNPDDPDKPADKAR
ncbi:MAG: hypothetical protein JO299_20015 [Gammaproteobacteria bacterium]|nr:hypothetical protein [Gammaproteobacteria bacterium]